MELIRKSDQLLKDTLEGKRDAVAKAIADVVFLLKRSSTLPAMIVELKWNQDAEGAIAQIKDRNYPKVLTNYGGKIVLVGVNYNADDKTHSCEIEEYRKADGAAN